MAQERFKIMSHCVSIHAPHEGERLANEVEFLSPKAVSIHAPHEGERPADRCIVL